MTVIAMTGATGFVGKATLAAALAEGHTLRALARREQAAVDGVAWVAGSLDDRAALSDLVAGADAVLHIAGAVNADAAGFERANVAGTQAVLDAALAVGTPRFVHVSSLAAREPALSLYGASKARAERMVATAPLASAIVRPPAVYGPGDTELLDLFRMAKRGLVTLPPGERLSVIHVADLAALLVALCQRDAPTGLFEADDGADRGWTHAAFGRAIGTAVGRRVRTVATPRAMLKLAALGDRLVRGDRAKLTADRVSYFCHPDWTIDPAARPPRQLWRPEIATHEGLAATAAWYREHGLL